MTLTPKISPELTGHTVFGKRDNIVSRLILDETILVPIAGNLADMQCIFSLEQVSAFIWEHIDGRNDVDAICSLLLAEFDVDSEVARADLREFLSEMSREDLIFEVPPAP